MSSNRTILGVFVAWMAMALPPAALAGTIRHDRSDQVHRSGAQSKTLAAVVQLLNQGSAHCSGTLIAPQWVLTASHCFLGRDYVFPQMTIMVGKQRFTVGPNDIYVHPDWVLGGYSPATTSGDLALVRLSRPVTAVTPIAINRGRNNEVGQTVYIAGFGSTGTGKTGATITTSVKRAGMNVIDATVANVVFPDTNPSPFTVTTVGSSRALLVDFDSPARNSSSLGDSAPLNLEYSAAPGDSGGPLLLYQGRVMTLAGNVSGGVFTLEVESAGYGCVGTFTRVASYLTWIDTVMSGRGVNLTKYVQTLSQDGGAVVRAAKLAAAERDVEFRRKGLLVQAWTGTSIVRSGAGQSPLSEVIAGNRGTAGNQVQAILEEINRGRPARASQPDRDRVLHDEPSFEVVTFPGCPSCGVPETVGD